MLESVVDMLNREAKAADKEKRRIAAINAKRSVPHPSGLGMYDARTTREVAETRKTEPTPPLQRVSRKARRRGIRLESVTKDSDGAYRRFNRLDKAA